MKICGIMLLLRIQYNCVVQISNDPSNYQCRWFIYMLIVSCLALFKSVDTTLVANSSAYQALYTMLCSHKCPIIYHKQLNVMSKLSQETDSQVTRLSYTHNNQPSNISIATPAISAFVPFP